jgi:hypothetical protein
MATLAHVRFVGMVGSQRRRPSGRRTAAVTGTLGIGLAAATLALGGCAAGQQAQTAQQVPTTDEIQVTVGNLDIRGIAVQPPTGNYYAKGGYAPLTMVIVNNGPHPDQLTKVSSSMFTGWGTVAGTSAVQPSATPSSVPDTGSLLPTEASPSSSSTTTPTTSTKPVTVAPYRRISFGVPEATSELVITGFTHAVYPATPLRMTFTFRNAGSVSITVPVQTSGAPGSQSVSPVDESGGAG